MSTTFYLFLDKVDEEKAQFDSYQLGTLSLNTFYSSQGYYTFQSIINSGDMDTINRLKLIDSMGKKHTPSEFIVHNGFHILGSMTVIE